MGPVSFGRLATWPAPPRVQALALRVQPPRDRASPLVTMSDKAKAWGHDQQPALPDYPVQSARSAQPRFPWRHFEMRFSSTPRGARLARRLAGERLSARPPAEPPDAGGDVAGDGDGAGGCSW